MADTPLSSTEVTAMLETLGPPAPPGSLNTNTRGSDVDPTAVVGMAGVGAATVGNVLARSQSPKVRAAGNALALLGEAATLGSVVGNVFTPGPGQVQAASEGAATDLAVALTMIGEAQRVIVRYVSGNGDVSAFAFARAVTLLAQTSAQEEALYVSLARG